MPQDFFDNHYVKGEAKIVASKYCKKNQQPAEPSDLCSIMACLRVELKLRVVLAHMCSSANLSGCPLLSVERQ